MIFTSWAPLTDKPEEEPILSAVHDPTIVVTLDPIDG